MILSPTPLAWLAGRNPKAVRWLLWVTAKNRATGLAESIGLWTGGDHAVFTIDGEARTYYGAQGALRFAPFEYVSGPVIQTTTVSVAVSPEAETLVRGYWTQFAPVEIHVAIFDGDTGALKGVDRAFRGFLDTLSFPTPEVGGEQLITLDLVSSARLGSMTGNARKSDVSQKLRSASDTFRAYSSLGTVASDVWGAGDMDPSRVQPVGRPTGPGVIEPVAPVTVTRPPTGSGRFA